MAGIICINGLCFTMGTWLELLIGNISHIVGRICPETLYELNIALLISDIFDKSQRVACFFTYKVFPAEDSGLKLTHLDTQAG